MASNTGVERVKEAEAIHHGQGRCEVFDYPREGLAGLKKFLNEQKLPFSFHAPLIRPHYFPYSGVTSFFINDDEEKRKLSFELMKQSAKDARDWGAEYMVCHLTYREDTEDAEKAWPMAYQAAEYLSELTETTGVPIHIEFAGYAGAFCKPEHFVEVISRYPNLGICIDTGHASNCAQLYGRNYLNDIETMAPYARSMHLWNTKSIEHWRKHGHVPLHPSQCPTEGWVDIEKTLEITLNHNKDLKLIHEYRIANMADEIAEGFGWIRDTVERFKGFNFA
ncbi:MAG TPA: sugar phosphate isomerase/epimerase family protein [Candidatus Avalokitesvara rifleensis]|uniref:sugar phosphate isomerase/epimerase family protein n=1 Tax=Candidatus Avalokitesvara rifleensis TaxID=3367620 RepID=UPI0027122DAD|nr:TIM barrel protein [Candidatus Brocadiales bacterium]